MFGWTAYPFVRLALAAVAGIYLQTTLAWLPDVWWPMGWLILLLILGLWLYHQRRGWSLMLFAHSAGTLGLFLMVGLYFSLSVMDQHHLRQVSEIPRSAIAYQGVVLAGPKVTPKTERYVVQIHRWLLSGGHLAAGGKLYFYLEKGKDNLQIGDELWVCGIPDAIEPPTTPGAFDFAAYSRRQNIHFQQFVTAVEIKKLGQSHSIPIYARRWSDGLSRRLDRLLTNPQAQQVAGALLLGRKQDVEGSLRDHYATTGTLHILAVSGLHVGIVFLVLSQLFTLFGYRRLNGFSGVLIIVLLWAYALFTGWSPSVLRAAALFSVITMGDMLRRGGNIYNSIGLAACLLLAMDTQLLFSVSFQLSFLAVLGIVYGYPIMNRWWTPGPWVLRKIWQLTLVSLAAQLATFPLSIYYFNQLPTYGLVANWVAVPAATILLPLGLLTLFVDTLWPMAGIWLGEILNALLLVLNETIATLGALPGARSTGWSISTQQVFCLYFIFVAWSLALARKWSGYAWMGTAGAALLLSAHLEKARVRNEAYSVQIYPIRNKTVIEVFEGSKAQLYTSATLEEGDWRYHIQPRRMLSGHQLSDQPVSLKEFSSSDSALQVCLLGGYRFLLLNGPMQSHQLHAPLSCEILLINGHAVRRVEWLMKHFHFKELIIGTQNSQRYADWLESEALARGWVVHNLKAAGYWEKPY